MNRNIFSILVLLSSIISAQISSITLSTVGAGVFTKNSDWKINKVTGWGGEVDAKFNLSGNLKITLSAGYQQFTIDQNKFALFAEYNWKYWNRYFGDINDPNFSKSTKWVQSILSDSTYSASFDPVQKMDVFPVLLLVSYEIQPGENITLRPSVGFGVAFFQKHLYVEETWKKKFDLLNNYVYNYSFHDMAENVNGNPLIGQLGMEGDYWLGDIVRLTAGLKYSLVFQTIKTSAYEHFPMKDIFSAKIGVSFLY